MKLKHIALCTALGLAAVAAHAGDNIFKVSVANITVHSESPDFTATGPAFLTPQPAGVTVGNATTVTFSYARRFDDNWDAEFILGIPPKHDVNGRGTLAPYGVVSQIKQAAPTAFLNYSFGKAGDTWRPFVGLGVNFTNFFSRNSTDSGNLASGGPTKITLSNSTGLAYQAGVSMKIDQMWSVCASVAGADVKTDMVASTGAIDRSTRLNLRPVVYSVGVAYSF